MGMHTHACVHTHEKGKRNDSRVKVLRLVLLTQRGRIKRSQEIGVSVHGLTLQRMDLEAALE